MAAIQDFLSHFLSQDTLRTTKEMMPVLYTQFQHLQMS